MQQNDKNIILSIYYNWLKNINFIIIIISSSYNKYVVDHNWYHVYTI